MMRRLSIGILAASGTVLERFMEEDEESLVETFNQLKQEGAAESIGSSLKILEPS